ncbi:uncharacterized protein BCR38DRAFT_446201 [Pseudomassariella vexata]|uniref:Uncharacterized protein n=1 Tax=Pseudomassariella vexata TaxID=1141098 RepID=A0A1Y2DJ89_9PEZI|nr:uncharacterized protein BCR38DRAFT_446201 [Pseudomassariella vexata]ORY59297.1 hypothetical protein BCR38DRAFT_446201 [Pseudomassariella vexata]
MMDQAISDIIHAHPFGKHLDMFRNSLNSSQSLDTVSNTGLQNLGLQLLGLLQVHDAARLLPTKSGRTLFNELPRLVSAITDDDFDFDRIRPLLNAVITNKPDN